MNNYKVLITTSGLGSRLNELTEYTNKSLIKIGDKAVLSYIIEKYDNNIEIVITLGYYGNCVKEYLKLAYPERHFTYINIENYKDEGLSTVESILIITYNNL